ncbi:uncharacterized protein METZ01_LOCUS129369, partial [marine metagenome]
VPVAGSRLIRRLYDWVLSWADTPYGLHALTMLAIAESSVFPIPADPLLVALCLGAPHRALRFAGIATVASVIGGILGYWIGAAVWLTVSDFFFSYVPGITPDAFVSTQGFYRQWDFWAIFIAGLTPVPYKVFTISAGVFSINFPTFVLASVLSRGARFFLVGGLIYKFGESIRLFIDRHFDWLTWLFGILVVLGFLVIELIV